MSESFAELFEESLNQIQMSPGSIIDGTIVAIDNESVIVNAGLKSEGVIPLDQFRNDSGEIDINVGDTVKVALDAVEDGFGETRLSREKAKRAEAWIRLETAYEDAETVTGIITGKVKGGFTVDVMTIRAFLPGSLVDVRPIRDTTHLEGVDLDFKVIKLDQKRNNVVVSRRSVIESENTVERDELLENMQEGMIVLDLEGRIIDINPVAHRLLFPSLREKIEIGASLAKYFPEATPSLPKDGQQNRETCFPVRFTIKYRQ